MLKTLSVPFVLAACLLSLVGCNSPEKLAFSSAPPERVTDRGELLLPVVQALDKAGKVIDGVKIDVAATPAGVLLLRPEGITVVNRGDVTLTWTAGSVTLQHTLAVRLPTRVELRCVPSCFGSVGSDTKLDTTVYSEDQVLADLQAPCSTDKPSVATVEGDRLTFVDKGTTTLTCRLGEAEVTRSIEVVPPAPTPPSEGAVDGGNVPSSVPTP
jgi:hypothetical protein